MRSKKFEIRFFYKFPKLRVDFLQGGLLYRREKSLLKVTLPY